MLVQDQTKDRDYFLRRADEERAKADACQDAAARAAHAELSQRYLQRAHEAVAPLRWVRD